MKKVSYFLSKKDKIPDLERNDLVYEFSSSTYCSEILISILYIKNTNKDDHFYIKNTN